MNHVGDVCVIQFGLSQEAELGPNANVKDLRKMILGHEGKLDIS